MKDEIAGGFVAVARFIVGVVLWNAVLLHLGRIVLLIVTFGRYPRGQALTRHANRIAFAGFMVIVLAWTSVALYNNFARVNTADLNHVAH